MKQLLIGILLLVILGIAGFFYRNAMEHPGPVGGACPADAKLCPDGSSVGRVAPLCNFAACPDGSVMVDSENGISYQIPAGYSTDGNAYTADTTLAGAFMKPSASPSVTHKITVRSYLIPEGKTANDVMLENTRRQPADMQVESMDEFEPVTINGKTYQSFVVERFEAIVDSVYYLPRENDVLKFEIVEHDVTDWMEPSLSIKNLPEHAAFRAMLGTVQSK